MLWILLGVVMIVLGLSYTSIYNKVSDASNLIQNIRASGGNWKPEKNTYHLLKDVDEYLKDQEEFDKYNARRLYYAELIENEARKLGITNLFEYWYTDHDAIDDRGRHTYPKIYVTQDNRFKWIFDEMKKEGVSLQKRESDKFWMHSAQVLTDNGYEWWLPKKTLQGTRLNYRKYWKDEVLQYKH